MHERVEGLEEEAFGLTPFDDDTALCGPKTPKAENIEDLIRYCLTVRKRFGKTCVQFSLSWGSSGLRASSDLRKRDEVHVARWAAAKAQNALECEQLDLEAIERENVLP